MRLSTRSLAGMARTLVAVGTVRLTAMFAAVRAAAPRSRTCVASALAGAAGGAGAPGTWATPDGAGGPGRAGTGGAAAGAAPDPGGAAAAGVAASVAAGAAPGRRAPSGREGADCSGAPDLSSACAMRSAEVRGDSEDTADIALFRSWIICRFPHQATRRRVQRVAPVRRGALRLRDDPCRAARAS